MTVDVYRKLRKHLDDLPGGFPATKTGVELRILERLFTPAEARFAIHLTLIPEAPRVIARRAKISRNEAAIRLEAMARRGLVLRIEDAPGQPVYMAAQFVVGIWEAHVNDLSTELIADMEAYKPYLRETAWKPPQVRTIPVGQSIHNDLEVMTYESAEALVARHDRFSINPCICRREKTMSGQGCDRPEASCLGFGIAADYAIKNGFGRAADQQEILGALKAANDHALVLQPANSQTIEYLCCCCGCCCDVLNFLKQMPQPAAWVSSAFCVEADTEKCVGCETCVDRCQMQALSMAAEKTALDADRCIGCGLCVTTCPGGALRLKRKPEAEQFKVPRNLAASLLAHGRARGKLGLLEVVKMLTRSKWDRLMALR